MTTGQRELILKLAVAAAIRCWLHQLDLEAETGLTRWARSMVAAGHLVPGGRP